MPVSLPIVLTLLLLSSSIWSGWKEPIRPSGVTLRLGHGWANNNPDQPSGFQTLHMAPSLEVPLTEAVGPRQLSGKIVWNPEVDLALFHKPYVRPAIGIHPLTFQYQMENHRPWVPYLLAGVGALYAQVDRPETGSDYNISLFAGLGVQYRFDDRHAWILEYRRRHVSNGDTTEENSGIDSHILLTGFSAFF